MNIELQEENTIDINAKAEKDSKNKEKKLLSKKRLRPKVINNYI